MSDRESLFDVQRGVDRETTQMQECGFVNVTGMTLAQVCQVIDNLGIDPHTVGFASHELVTLSWETE